MSKEFASHIFDEFSQENSGARTQYQGTSLGMAITKRYVELMGGTITVESTKGKGTTFTVELPLTLADPIEKREAYTAPVQKRTTDLHVLMAEDNAFAEDVVKCKETGMDSHLPKPFKADQLIASIIAPKN